MRLTTILPAVALAALAPDALGQGALFTTPGMPGSSIPGTPAMLGQTTRFSSEFNPAMGFVVDTLFDYASFDAPGAPDGFDAQLRLFEFTGAAWIDPKAWAYTVIAAEGGDESIVRVEEAALDYVGLPSNFDIKAGRFFVDFGKQMQSHVHDLRTVERPLVLRTYLGSELGGDGIQVGNWHAVGEESALRYSLGVFGSALVLEEEDDTVPTPSVTDRQNLDALNVTGRLTGFADLGTGGVFQLGGSLRAVPDYTASDPSASVASVEGLSSAVWGTDLTYGWVNDTGLKRATAGVEYLWNTGDTGISFDDPNAPTSIQVFDETVQGYYAFFDYAFDQFNSTGIQWSTAELPTDGKPETSELDVYFTHGVSEFQRVRLAVTFGDSGAPTDGAYTRVAIQYTAFLGPHSHGINW